MAIDPEALVGRWELLSWQAVDDDGRVTQPFGERPRGLFICLPDGWAAVQMAATERPRLTGDLPATSLEDRARAVTTYLAYAGRYAVQGDTVVIRPVLSLYPQWLGVDQVRQVAFDGDELILRPPPVQVQGRRQVHELRWRRAEAGRAS